MSSIATPARPPPTPLSRIEAHYRKSLASRWLEFTWRAGVWTGLAFGGSLFILTGFHLATFPLAFCVGLLLYPFTIYPILWVRRSYVTSPPLSSKGATLRSLLLSTLFDGRTVKLLTTYVSCGSLFTWLYAQLLTSQKSSVELGIFNPTPRHPLHLNERFLFLLVGNALFLLLLGVRDVFGYHFLATWPKKKMPFARAVQNTLLESIPSFDQALTTFNPLIISVGSAGLYTVAYFAWRSTIWRFILTHFAFIFRNFMINFARSSRSNVTWSLLPHLVLLEATFTLALQLPASAMMAYITQPLNFAAFTAKSPLTPDRYLLTALQSQNPYYINFTLMELLRVCRIPQRRKAIFEDVSKSPTLTNELWQNLMSILERSQAILMTRGGTRSTAPAAPKPAAPSNPDPRSIPIRQADIFKPVTKKRSTIETIVQNVLDGPGKPPVQAIVPLPVGNALLKVSDKARAVEAKALEGAKKTVQETLGTVKSLDGVKSIENGKVGEIGKEVVKDVVGAWEIVHQSLGGIYVHRYRVAIPNPQQIRWVIDIMAVLAVASTEEDIYGNVQQVLPSTFDTILRLRQAILGYQSELNNILNPSRSQKLGILSVQNEIDQIIFSIDDGLRRICEKFGESLTAFKLPSTVSATLSDICK